MTLMTWHFFRACVEGCHLGTVQKGNRHAQRDLGLEPTRPTTAAPAQEGTAMRSEIWA
jgi:hypothetical protein